MRNRRRRERNREITPKRRKHELRNHAAASLEREAQLLDQILASAARGGVVAIPQLKPAYEKALGRSIALSTLYRILARHGWRKLAPDTAHPQGDAERREDFKKTPQPGGRSAERFLRCAPAASDVPG